MGRSTTAITVEQAEAIIRGKRLRRATWSEGLQPPGRPVEAEQADDGAVILYYGTLYRRTFVEYTAS